MKGNLTDFKNIFISRNNTNRQNGHTLGDSVVNNSLITTFNFSIKLDDHINLVYSF